MLTILPIIVLIQLLTGGGLGFRRPRPLAPAHQDPQRCCFSG
jgi:hypothetical protein